MLTALAVGFSNAAELADELGDESDGSRTIAVHLINLFDEEGVKITSEDEMSLPFSVEQTCSQCHTVDIIRHGWHFNYNEPNVPAGRIGQPWIFVDPLTATQIPLSFRDWPGAYHPNEIGMSNFQFVKTFGRQLPGGGAGNQLSETDDPQEVMRSMVSGKLEINCLSCHNASHGQDRAIYADQIIKENFRWAPTAACEFASVTGTAAAMPDMYDYLMPEIEGPQVPQVYYRKSAFDFKERILFNIERHVPNERCYACHSNFDLSSEHIEKWMGDQDVHLMSGLDCVDCHRNGIEHDIIRGYAGESKWSNNPLVSQFTCEGCHIPWDVNDTPKAGRLGAPVAKHWGIPPVHFEKLTCTACHSGPFPRDTVMLTKTSRAHGLGTYGTSKSHDVLPHIQAVVFAEGSDGRIGPHKMIWPAFWASINEDKVTPIAIESVKETLRPVISMDESSRKGNWPRLNDEHLVEALKALVERTDGKPAYVAGGSLYSLTGNGQLTTEEHPAAEPYLWPIAHDVRPEAQSLGAAGCEDCHSKNAPFAFASIGIDTPVINAKAMKQMIDFQKLDTSNMNAIAATFILQPVLIVVIVISVAVCGAVLVLYGLKCLSGILKLITG